MNKYFLIPSVIVFTFLGCSKNQDKSHFLSNDSHSYANFNDVRISHLNLDLTVDFQQNILDGKVDISIKNYTNAKQLILDSKDLTIHKVLLEDSKETPFALGDHSETFGQPLVVDIKPTTKMVSVYYTTSPDAEALQWLTPEQTLGKKHPFLFSQSQAILARSWVPCQDGPGVKFTYDATIKTDSNLIALMSAENGTSKSDNGIYTFKMDQPISSYLLALTVGDLEFAST